MLSLVYGLAAYQLASVEVPLKPHKPCGTEHHAAFDFWVGEWSVAPNGTGQTGTYSTIERTSSGCVITEHWQPASGRNGNSISFFNPNTQRWEQIWVGSDGNRVDFAGGLVDGKMVLVGYWTGSGPNGEDVLTRMTYSTLQDGKVRQLGEGSTDHGISWQTSFDLIYTPKDTE